jgi:transposase
VLRQEHKAGEKVFVDFTGQMVPIVDRTTGEVLFEAEIFVGVLGASNYTYAQACRSQELSEWISAHTRMVEYFGGVPAVVVPDNLKSGVRKACFYEPDINPTYHDWAQHYGTVVLPTRVRRPRDKAKVEAGVLLVERWILARLRHHTFFSLAELDEQIRRLLEWLNNRAISEAGGQPAVALRDAGPAGAAGAAGAARDPLRLRPVEEGAAEHRLSHRRAGPLLQRALSPPGGTGRRTHHE